MRPLKLTMTAFGPYAGVETVDFRDAIASGLFGIYRSTGSGKSTIFTAMVFALFGEAAKREQDSATLRSDHASADILTEVEFIFEIGEARYLIRRRPDQVRPAKRGGGEAKEKHIAWFFDVTGIDVDDITLENTGKLIQEKKVGAVKLAIQERLGYGADQFKQIVLLPQGEFEKFLKANTDARRKILRELFDVSLYRKLTEGLHQESKEAARLVRQDREICAARLLEEGFESSDALKSGIAQMHEAQITAETIANTAYATLSVKRISLQTGERVSEKFTAYEDAKTVLSSLIQKEPLYIANKVQIENLRKAQSLLDVDTAQNRTLSHVKTAKENVEMKQAACQEAQTIEMKARNDLEYATESAQACEELQRSIDDLARYKVTIEDAEVAAKKMRSSEGDFISSEATLKATETVHSSATTHQADVQDRLKIAQKNAVRRELLNSDMIEARQVKLAVEDYRLTHKGWQEATNTVLTAEAKDVEMRGRVDATQRAYDLAEKALAAAQAQHLAEKLEDGQACSVCGSKNHPNPAMAHVEGTDLDKAFREARSTLDNVRLQNEISVVSLSKAEAILKERETSFEKLTQPNLSEAEVDQKISGLMDEISQLGVNVMQSDIEAELVSVIAKLKDVEADLTKVRNRQQDAKTSHALAKQAYEIALQTVPETLRSKPALARTLQDKTSKLEALSTALTEAKVCATQTREKVISVSKEFEAAQSAVVTAHAQYEDAQRVFEDRLVALGFSQGQFSALKENIPRIEGLQVEVDAYESSLVIGQDKVKISSEAIDGLDRPDLGALRVLVEEAEANHTEKMEAAMALKARHAQLITLLSSISEMFARIEVVEKDTAELRELAALFNANNLANLDLETFAIGTMFDQVLQAANLRLRPMTSGRYSLERERESGKGRSRQGLGISIYDINTGKARATSTLSGGETFIAALSLALGLSDIVESMSGNIRLDTIFIDEGFGSLDTDNEAGTLDQVLQTLQNLVGDNRAVGLISHVPLVQQAIPNGFTIKKTASGSHVEARNF